MKKSTRVFLFLFLDLLIVIVGGGLFLRHAHFFAANNSPTVGLTKKPSVTHLSLSSGDKEGDYTMYSLPGDLAQAKLNDIVFADGAMWIGANKGLIKIKGSQVTVYRQFSNWPFEWIEHLVVTSYGLAVNTLVAQHNYGGNYAGSYLFEIKHETWRHLGRNILAQAWLNGYLYQVSSELIRLDPQQSWKKQVVLPRVCKYRMSILNMRAINRELWLTGDSVRRGSHGCGVIRYNPETGKRIEYLSKDGLNDDRGRDLGGDADDVFVTYSIKSAYVSRFNQNSQTWQSLHASGTGNSIAVTPHAIWLASPFPTHPLIRIDRNTSEKKLFPALAAKEYVSAIGVKDQEVWFGTYVTNWQGQGFTIQSRLGRYIDRH